VSAEVASLRSQARAMLDRADRLERQAAVAELTKDFGDAKLVIPVTIWFKGGDREVKIVELDPFGKWEWKIPKGVTQVNDIAVSPGQTVTFTMELQ
jgi:hypothetical protein